MQTSSEKTVYGVRLDTALDWHGAVVRPDGSFLTLVRENAREVASDNLTEVRISGHDHPALVRREIEDRFIGSIKPQYIADVNGLVSAVCQGLHHHR